MTTEICGSCGHLETEHNFYGETDERHACYKCKCKKFIPEKSNQSPREKPIEEEMFESQVKTLYSPTADSLTGNSDFVLSKRDITAWDVPSTDEKMYYEEDVIEFIRRLIADPYINSNDEASKRIRELAGDLKN